MEHKKKFSLATAFYESLFFGKGKTLGSILSDIAVHLKPTQQLDQFLSNLFFVFVGNYSRSLYGTNAEWETLQKLILAIQTLVKYSKSIQNVQVNHEAPNVHVLEVPSEDLAITALEKVRQKKTSITVLNTYCGVPIQYSAKVVHTTANSVLIKAHTFQNITASLQGNIYILQGTELDSDLSATVKPLSIKNINYLELTHFEQLPYSLHKRQSVRVYPTTRIDIPLMHKSRKLHTTAFDLSIGGIALLSERALHIQLDEQVVITLPETLLGGRSLTIESTLVHISLYEEGFKYHFQIDPDPLREGIISRFIIKRQKEIIRMLKDKVL